MNGVKIDTKDPLILRLSEQFNLKPFLVGYLRLAMKNGVKTYNRTELIQHIYEGLPHRFTLIQEVISRTDIDDTTKSIKIFRLARDNKFRLEVVDFLKTVKDEILFEICR